MMNDNKMRVYYSPIWTINHLLYGKHGHSPIRYTSCGAGVKPKRHQGGSEIIV